MTGNTLDQSVSAVSREGAEHSDGAGRRDRPGRRGPHALVALGGFAALVAAALGVVTLLVTIARLLQSAV